MNRQPEIIICPLKRLYSLLQDDHSCAVGIVSSSHPLDASKLNGIPFVFQQYDDVDREIPGRSLSPDAALQFARFIRQLSGETRRIYCSCDSGMSRSSAIACAVHRYFGLDDLRIWENPHYQPNLLVFSMVTSALEIPVSDLELDALFETNRRALSAAIRAHR